jgi:hypothetical protein
VRCIITCADFPFGMSLGSQSNFGHQMAPSVGELDPVNLSVSLPYVAFKHSTAKENGIAFIIY